jgi:sporulation protein YlmC with PRC-barrel domain
MKTSLLLAAMLAVLGASVVPASAQTQSTTVQVSKLVGTKVKSAQGEEIGVIKDAVLDRSSGCIAYTVLSGDGGKLVAVPWAVYSPTADVNILTVTVDRKRIHNAPVFDYARIDQYSGPDYITKVYNYYGVSLGAVVPTPGAIGRPEATASPSGGAELEGKPSSTTRESPAEAASPGETTKPTPSRPHRKLERRESASPPERPEQE